ncbi:hypothetical protein JYT91_01310, partial [archaeon AH-315-M20]|nr:hypothetical protein [archaeon AH-315-M20]
LITMNKIILNKGGIETVSNISDLVRDGSIPSITQMEEEGCGDLVDHIVFGIATNFTRKRESGHAYARHIVDSMIRDRVWGVDWENSLATNTMLPGHDNGENIGETFPGAMAVNRWNGWVSGEDYEVAADFMTDWYGTAVKTARARGASTAHKLGKEITKRDVIDDIEAVRHILVSNDRINQEVALDRVSAEFGAFQRGLDDSDIPESDKTYYLELLRTWNKHLERAKRSPIPLPRIKQATREHIDMMIASMESAYDKGDYSFFDGGGSVAYHAAREVSYDVFAGRIVNFDGKVPVYLGRSPGAKVTAFTVYDLIGAKNGDSADNARTPKSDNFVDLARLHLKTEILIKAEEEMLKQEPDSPERDNALKQLYFLKGQLAYRVTADAGRVGLHVDSTYDPTKIWIRGQLKYIHDVFGDEFMDAFRTNLRKRQGLLAMREDDAREVLNTYSRLYKQYVEIGWWRRVSDRMSGLSKIAANL